MNDNLWSGDSTRKYWNLVESTFDTKENCHVRSNTNRLMKCFQQNQGYLTNPGKYFITWVIYRETFASLSENMLSAMKPVIKRDTLS